jgi:molybdate transport system ATP-binding protein
METTLHLDLDHGLRAFRLELALEIGAETVALVGPSGAGKSSVLRAVAGLLRPERGSVAYGGDVWLDTARGIDVSPDRRRVGLVFQEYALFPHLDVSRNVAFGARDRRKLPELLQRLRIDGLAHAHPRELSGGEQQRVALARALARKPDVLLLDEPLSALDAHTRGTVRAELHELLAELRLPTLLVTHDFEDAATLADRVGVIVDGHILQLATPNHLVAAPSDSFVASFTGANLLSGVAGPAENGLTQVTLDAGGSVWTTDAGAGRVAVAVYPWEVSLSLAAPDDSAVNHLRAPIASLVQLGNRVRVRVGPLTAEVTAQSVTRLGLREGDVVVATFKATGARLLPFA